MAINLTKTEEQLTNEVMGKINLSKDKEKLDKLWISSPVKLNFNEDNKYKRFPKRFSLQILPVADKKWLGKL